MSLPFLSRRCIKVFCLKAFCQLFFVCCPLLYQLLHPAEGHHHQQAISHPTHGLELYWNGSHGAVFLLVVGIKVDNLSMIGVKGGSIWCYGQNQSMHSIFPDNACHCNSPLLCFFCSVCGVTQGFQTVYARWLFLGSNSGPIRVSPGLQLCLLHLACAGCTLLACQVRTE